MAERNPLNSLQSKAILTAFGEAQDQWIGCAWQANLGPHGTDLCGLKSHQAALLAQATSGKESKAWEEASRWLKEVEQDAQAAQRCAFVAIQFAQQQDFANAIRMIDAVYALESKYRTPETWRPLTELLHSICSDECDPEDS